MFAYSYAVCKGTVVACAGHGARSSGGVYGFPPEGASWRLEVFDLRTGRRLWRGRRPWSEPFEAIGLGERFLLLRQGLAICLSLGRG